MRWRQRFATGGRALFKRIAGQNSTTANFEKVLGRIKHVNARAYTPQAQGAIERFNGTLKRHLSSASLKSRGSNRWSELLSPFLK